MVFSYIQEYTLKKDNEIKFVFAKIYGFKNIQNLVRNLKKKTPYHYIEIMACPAGCLNGGGQVKSKEFLVKFIQIGTEQKSTEKLVQLEKENAFFLQKLPSYAKMALGLIKLYFLPSVETKYIWTE